MSRPHCRSDKSNCSRYADTENRHVHIVANRIDPETHQAIQPAGRWTHKAIQRASRKIEIAQGWNIETRGCYAVTDDGTLIEKIEAESNPKLSQTALDVKAQTAAKSAKSAIIFICAGS